MRRRFKISTSTTNKQRWVSLPVQALIGVVLGIVAGLFFGNYCSWLAPIGKIYIKLLQVVVYPYLICSLLHGLGDISPAIAKRLFKQSWIIYIILVLLVFITIGLLAWNIPEAKPLFIQFQQKISNPFPQLLNLLVPDNLITALSLNYIPAIVVFCVIFGFMLQRVEKKVTFLALLDTIAKTSVKYWEWLVIFIPYALFALVADTAGNIQLSVLNEIGLYLLLFALGSSLLAFWVLPGILSSLLPVTYRELIRYLRPAFIVGIATTLSVAALPYIEALIRKLLKKTQISDSETSKDIMQTSLAVSYPFAQLGNFFLYLFILFAVFYFSHPLTKTQEWLLPIITWLSSIGAPSTTINSTTFLAHWLGLPQDTTGLYVELLTITRYFQVLISVMGIAFMAIVMTFAYYKKIQVNKKKLLGHLGGFLLLLMLFSGVLLFYKPQPRLGAHYNYLDFRLNPNLTANVTVKVIPFSQAEQTPNLPKTKSLLLQIENRGVLYVGYNPKVMPYAYFNKYGELVGYDIAYAYKLAKALRVKLVFVPFRWNDLVQAIQTHKFDMAVSAITIERLRNVLYSTPTHHTTMAMIAHRKQMEFMNDKQSIIKHDKLSTGVLDSKDRISLLKSYLPQAKLAKLVNYPQGINQLQQNSIDTIFLPKEQAIAHASQYENLAAIEPSDLRFSVPIAFMIPQHAILFSQFLNRWIDLQQLSGFQKKIRDYWLLGKPIKKKAPRWSIMRNVLHWIG